MVEELARKGVVTGWKRSTRYTRAVLFERKIFWGVSSTFNSPPPLGCAVRMSITGPEEADSGVGDVLLLHCARAARLQSMDVTGTLVITTGFRRVLIVGFSCNISPGVTDWACSTAGDSYTLGWLGRSSFQYTMILFMNAVAVSPGIIVSYSVLPGTLGCGSRYSFNSDR